MQAGDRVRFRYAPEQPWCDARLVRLIEKARDSASARWLVRPDGEGIQLCSVVFEQPSQLQPAAPQELNEAISAAAQRPYDKSKRRRCDDST